MVSGYSRDPQGRLLLHSAPSVAEGRSWSLAKAAQLIRNDARPNLGWHCRWTTGPGVCSGPAAACERCREQLAAEGGHAEASSALVPVSAERVLDLVLSNDRSTSSHSPLQAGLPRQSILKWVGLTSAVWLVILALISAGLLHQLERQDRKLDLLLERLEATDINP